MEDLNNFIAKNVYADAASWNWGSVPEWFAAIGTLAAVIVALVIALGDSRRRVAQLRREQAEKIAAWKVHPGGEITEATIHVANGSHLPIYDVVLSYGVSYGNGARYTNGNKQQILVLKFPPGNHIIRRSDNPIKLKSRNILKYGVAISFRDSSGRFWRRDASGYLCETKNHPFVELQIKQPIPHSRWVLFVTPSET